MMKHKTPAIKIKFRQPVESNNIIKNFRKNNWQFL